MHLRRLRPQFKRRAGPEGHAVAEKRHHLGPALAAQDDMGLGPGRLHHGHRSGKGPRPRFRHGQMFGADAAGHLAPLGEGEARGQRQLGAPRHGNAAARHHHPGRRFIDGLPMKPATKVFAGVS